MWEGDYVEGQNNKNFSRRIYMNIEFIVPKGEKLMVLFFLTTNMAAVTSQRV